MVRIGRGRVLEELPGLESVPTLHHPHAELVQDGRVFGRELRRADKELIGLAAASCGAGGLCRLDHPEHGGVLRGYRFDVVQRVLGIWSLRAWILAWRTQLSGTRRRSEEHTSELQSRSDLVCRLLLEKK